jgi:hypothetical protein
MSKITSQTKAITACSLGEMKECYSLLERDFDGVTWKEFLRDFCEKDHVMVLLSDSGAIVGFSTLMTIALDIPGRKVWAIFSGDTAVMRECRDSTGFSVELAKYFAETAEKYPNDETYYVLISKGWRTYRVVPFYFKEFAPSYRSPTDMAHREVIDAFGRKKYPKNYDSNSGLLIFDGTTQRLKAESTDAIAPTKPNKDADFFFKKNPDFLLGNEIVCAARVTPENFTEATKRLLTLGRKEET